MGLDKIEIDFTKCKNNIILLKGVNGSGKSTLLNALNLFPDPSSAFVPMKDAEKRITIADANDIYEIQILSPADNNGNRKTTKAFIKKNGIELNSNGNISSYKDILFSEFELDANFVSLTKMSNDAKGLGGLTPSERKKFASNIIDNLEVYNDMYKNLNKRSSIFKSYINNLHIKIQNIGSKDNIEMTLKSLRQKEHDISIKIMELNNLIVSIQTKSSIDEEEANKINLLNSRLNDIELQINNIQTKVNLYIHKTQIKESNIENTYNEHNNALKQYEIESEKFKAEWVSNSDKLKSNTESINLLEAEMSTYSNITNNDIEARYNSSKNSIDNIISEINKLGYKEDESLIYPLSSLIDYIDELSKLIDSLYYEATISDIKYITSSKYNPNKVSELQVELNELYTEISNNEVEMSLLRDKIKVLSVLDNRPKKCNIDVCPFIVDAINIKNEYGDKALIDKLSTLQELQMKYSTNVAEINNKIALAMLRDSKKSILDRITESIEKNIDKLKLFNLSNIYNIDTFYKLLSNMNQFNELRDPRVFIDLLNNLKIYSELNKSFSLLSVQYDSYKDKIKMMKSNMSILNKLKEEQDQLTIKVSESKSNYDKYNGLKASYSSKVLEEKEYLDLYKKLLELNSNKNYILDQLDEYNRKSSKALEALSNINTYKDQINNLTKEAEPINTEIGRLNNQLTMLDSYYQEYEMYNDKYNTIETLKKYCSPTNGGIQVLFMQLYMSKTLELSNQILSMLFNGEYRLLDFVINQNEFRIPFVGNGLPVDDISNGSSSQVCMMSMIINLVLAHQASSKFNVTRLDEIDNSLDTYNRSNFVNVLYRVLPLLNIEQLFIISHSLELDATSADIIKLKSYDDYESYSSSNIIWDYQDAIKS